MTTVTASSDNPLRIASRYVKNLINPMVSAAAPLLNFVVQPIQVTSKQDLGKVHQNLIKRIKVFEKQLRKSGYRTPFILMAKHILCAFMDEMILIQPWAKLYLWQDKTLLWQFAHKQFANQDFFMLLEQALKLSRLNLDVLELGYTCLSLGFLGKYRYMTDGQQKLAIFSDDIYEVIRKNRGEHSRVLLVSSAKFRTKKWWLWLPSKKQTIFLTIVILLAIGWGYHRQLIGFKQPIYRIINTLQLNIKEKV